MSDFFAQALVFALDFALACYALALVCAAWRLAIGPSTQDRILALDTLYINGLLIILLLGVRLGSLLYFDIALLIALFGFVGSAALAKFLLRGEVIEA
ncbi:K+/H+ antiporter subunit F [Azonexus sp.]|uniref:K+/H+ antiporter subunit F n=1 Tax=Azonexus sp. TaxID=1872668 RepID=UPI0039E664EF